MKKNFICSQFSGDIAGNIERAKAACKFVIDYGHAPFAPHLIYPQILDDKKPEDRENGFDCGIAFLGICDEIWYFKKDSVVSSGMEAELKFAEHNGIPTKEFDFVFYENKWEVVPF